jgi:hypothetical protein
VSKNHIINIFTLVYTITSNKNNSQFKNTQSLLDTFSYVFWQSIEFFLTITVSFISWCIFLNLTILVTQILLSSDSLSLSSFLFILRHSNAILVYIRYYLHKNKVLVILSYFFHLVFIPFVLIQMLWQLFCKLHIRFLLSIFWICFWVRYLLCFFVWVL